MSNKMSQIYVAIVEDIIRDSNNDPTMSIRIRIPNMHSGLKTKDLPIAKPMYTPGAIIDKSKFLQQIDLIRKVYVIFEYGDLTKPRYLGVPEFLDGSQLDLSELTLDIEIVDTTPEEGTYISKLTPEGQSITVERKVLPEGGTSQIDIPLLESGTTPDTSQFRVFFEIVEE